MKEAVVGPGPKVTIRDVPIPTPEAGQVVTRVVASGTNPKDWLDLSHQRDKRFLDDNLMSSGQETRRDGQTRCSTAQPR